MIGEWNNGTGRRKSSVARVFLKKGSGQITVNGKDIQAFFGRQTSIMIVKQPLVLTNNVESFDIQVNVHGGGESGQAGATRHGITRIQAKGEKLDPHRHQAMVELPSTDVEPGSVIEEMQPGYMMKDRLLRPALVGVAKKPD